MFSKVEPGNVLCNLIFGEGHLSACSLALAVRRAGAAKAHGELGKTGTAAEELLQGLSRGCICPQGESDTGLTGHSSWSQQLPPPAQ